MPRAAFSQIVNRSMSEVLTRSLATSFCTALPILSLLLFGGSTLKDFAFALFIGVASGTYSSMFVASPMLALLKEREPKFRNIAARVQQRARQPQLRPAPATAAADGGDGEREAGAPAPRAGTGETPRRPSSTGPKRKRKTTAAQRRRR